ncbi:hypothetical protein WAK64_15290 [Bacillus spongiae]|uniref:DUF3221 domain-containing protein n=1 Tax=Bacillus spongiae TaxID=2683610 RepID=A0ABU8HGW7_9BACI
MNRKLLVFLVSIFFVASALSTWYFVLKPDYIGKIFFVTKEYIMIGPVEVDPEADYNVYKIYIDKNTVIKDSGSLVKGNIVKVWVEELHQKDQKLKALKIDLVE